MNSREPQIGEIRQGKDLLYKGYVTSHSKFQYLTCEVCGKARWVRLTHGKPRGLTKGKVCKLCAVRKFGANKSGNGSSAWKGGRGQTSDGYITIWVGQDDFFYPMANSNGRILEHRLVVAKALGRCLHSWEVVHHKGIKYPVNSKENKQDNRYPENLQLASDERHQQITILENKIRHLRKKNQELKMELEKLKPKEFNLVNLEEVVDEMGKQSEREGTMLKGKMVFGLGRETLERKAKLSTN